MPSGYTTPASLEEKQQLQYGSSNVHPRRNNKKRNIIIAVVVALVVVIALAVGLGVGLSKKKSSEEGGSSLPTAGEDDSLAGLQETGMYYTSYSDDSTQFQYAQTNFTLSSGAPSSTSTNPIILLNTSQVGQTMDGWGAALTDGGASLFANLKTKDIVAYNNTLDFLFNQRTGINILRVPIGTSDFSPESLQYTMADEQGVQANVNDTQGPLSYFNMDGANTYIIPFIKDALLRNSNLKISLLPWSPPAWMKSNGSVNGGTLQPGSTRVLAEYLVKTVQAFKDELGITPWALAVQNEPTNPTAYPSMSLTNDYVIPILAILRGRLAELGMGGVQLLGHEDNYNGYADAAALVAYNESSLDGISWHCYSGSSSLLSSYQAALVNVSNSGKSMHMTECSGEDAADGNATLTGLKWWMDNIFSQPSQGVSSVVIWNLALDSDNGPRLKRAYCTKCDGTIQIDNTKVTSNFQSILTAHHATASSNLTRFDGSSAYRIGSAVSNDDSDCIASNLAFRATFSDSTQRLGLVVQNTCTNNVTTTISLNNEQTFDAVVGYGVTTVVFTA